MKTNKGGNRKKQAQKSTRWVNALTCLSWGFFIPCQKISFLEPQGFQRINKNIFKIYLVN